MSSVPFPVAFRPIFKPRPWGGRRLETMLGKSLPDESPIGESWELVSLPGDESTVRDGPMAGRTLSELISAWGRGLLGDVELLDGRFPLLIKFLDARENLSVQVHPRPRDDARPGIWQPGVKHEAWYVLDAEPGSELFIGLMPGVTRDDVRRAANSLDVARLIRRWPAQPGQCYYVPSGTLHALGAGVLVAEIQTPSDTTYRLFDWGRTGRELHVSQAIENVDFDLRDEQISQPRRHVAGVHSTVSRLCVTQRFLIEKVRLVAGVQQDLQPGDMAVWIVTGGEGRISGDRITLNVHRGDVVLIPADCAGSRVEALSAIEWLEVRVPVIASSPLSPHPPPESPPSRDGMVPITRDGRRI